MIAFSSGNVLGKDRGADYWTAPDGRNYILSVKYGGGYCVSKALVTSVGVPCQITIILVLDRQADIVAIPELFTSAYIPWRSPDTHRLAETALAFTNAGVCGQFACCAAIAVNIIYDVIGRNYIDYSGEAKDCIFTSSGTMELNDECRDRILSSGHVLSDFPVDGSTANEGGGLPF